MGYQSRIKFDAAGPFKVRHAFDHDGVRREFGTLFDASHIPVPTRQHMFDAGWIDMVGPDEVIFQATPGERVELSQPGNTEPRTYHKKKR